MRKNAVYIVLTIFLILTISLFYFLNKVLFTPFTSPDKEASSHFNIQPVSKSNSFVGPIKEVMGVTFQHYFELSPNASFSQLGLYDVVVKTVATNKDSGYLVVKHDKKTLHLPLIGVLSIKQHADGRYKQINVGQLSNFIKNGDKLIVHLMYTSPLTTLNDTQIRHALRNQSKKKVLSSEEMMVVEAISRTGITENDILGMLNTNNEIKFRPSQLFVTLIEVQE